MSNDMWPEQCTHKIDIQKCPEHKGNYKEPVRPDVQTGIGAGIYNIDEANMLTPKLSLDDRLREIIGEHYFLCEDEGEVHLYPGEHGKFIAQIKQAFSEDGWIKNND